MRQYEIWWARLPEPAGERPVMLLSRNDAYRILNRFVAVEVTTRVRGIPVEVDLGSVEGLPRLCVANCDNLFAVARGRLVRRMDRLAPERWREVKRAVGYAFAWEELMGIGS